MVIPKVFAVAYTCAPLLQPQGIIWVAIEGLHYAKTGVIEQELDGRSTTQMIE
jgi:hypothetical protein